MNVYVLLKMEVEIAELESGLGVASLLLCSFAMVRSRKVEKEGGSVQSARCEEGEKVRTVDGIDRKEYIWFVDFSRLYSSVSSAFW